MWFIRLDALATIFCGIAQRVVQQRFFGNGVTTMKTMLRALALALACVAAQAAYAQSGVVQTRLEAHKVERAADGRETLGDAQAARPGDVIEYTATYRNTGKQPVRNLEATLPIPPNTEYVAGTAQPAQAKASIDAHAFGVLPLTRHAVRDGKPVEEAVPVSEYRYLRWYPNELEPGKSVSFSARVRVIADAGPGEAARGSGK
jgi:uncharacterized repeat protein (TIGR01451 family)